MPDPGMVLSPLDPRRSLSPPQYPKRGIRHDPGEAGYEGREDCLEIQRCPTPPGGLGVSTKWQSLAEMYRLAGGGGPLATAIPRSAPARGPSPHLDPCTCIFKGVFQGWMQDSV